MRVFGTVSFFSWIFNRIGVEYVVSSRGGGTLLQYWEMNECLKNGKKSGSIIISY